MKDYSLDKTQAKDYLLNFRLVQNGENEDTYEVTFADGRVFGSVIANEENLQKFERVQEAQAKKGVENKHIFQSKKTKSGVATFVSAIASAVAGYGLVNGAITLSLIPGTELVIAAGIGVITVLGTIPEFAKLMKNKAKVDELEKIEYRDEHQDKLSQIDNYANALSGVSTKTRVLIDEEENPFSILNIDRYTLSDLEIIIDNMEREQRSGFQYKKGTK